MTIHAFRRRAAALIGLVAVVVLLAGSVPAEAGCFGEYNGCVACFKKKMWQGLQSRDVSLILEAYSDGIDCDIDLVHCIFYGMHHAYRCPE